LSTTLYILQGCVLILLKDLRDKFKKFEGHLNKWATRGANPKEVRGMIKEFKDSDHYRKWGETDRLQDNIARLETVLGAS
jgi:hypothetical protein